MNTKLNQYHCCPVCNEVYTGKSCPNWRKHPRQKGAGRPRKWGDLGELQPVSIRLPTQVIAFIENNYGGVQAHVDKQIITLIALTILDEVL